VSFPTGFHAWIDCNLPGSGADRIVQWRRHESRRPDGKLDTCLGRSRRVRLGYRSPAGGVMKNNVKIALSLGAALVLFLVVVRFFPLTGAGR
jgi:hypothetical protein